MSTVVAGPRPITAEEFSALPDTKGFELLDGIVVQKNMGAVAADTLDVEDVLPGFTCRVADFFPLQTHPSDTREA